MSLRSDQVSEICINDDAVGQRLDNFLLKICKGVPKSHLYRIIRSGEVRVNRGRIQADYRLQFGDRLRIPPIRLSAVLPPQLPPTMDALPVVYEDDAILVVNKPAGLAAHGGSGVSYGVIEQLRHQRPGDRALALVHRLDRETSGLLVLAKKRTALVAMQAAIRERRWHKRYQTLVLGQWPEDLQRVELPLRKLSSDDLVRKVVVDRDRGQAARTDFQVLAYDQHPTLGPLTLLDVRLITGRTHQIRVHTSAKGYPIAGDARYGSFAINRQLAQSELGGGLKRMFLHAGHLRMSHPISHQDLELTADLPDDLSVWLGAMRKDCHS